MQLFHGIYGMLPMDDAVFTCWRHRKLQGMLARHMLAQHMPCMLAMLAMLCHAVCCYTRPQNENNVRMKNEIHTQDE